MKKTILSITAILMVLLVISPMILPGFAQLSINISCSVEDITNDHFPDVIFTATDILGNPQENIKIDLIAADTATPLISGETDLFGVLVFKNVPADNYTWISGDQTGFLEVKPITIDLSEEEAALITFLLNEWGTDSAEGNKGRLMLDGLGRFVGYPSASSPVSSDNYARAIHYYNYLSGLENHLYSRSLQNRDAIMRTVVPIIYSMKTALTVLGKTPQPPAPPIPPLPDLYVSPDEHGLIQMVVGGHFNLPTRTLFATGIGVTGLGLIILGFADLFVFSKMECNVRVSTPELELQHAIDVGKDIYVILQGFSYIFLSVGRYYNLLGPRATIYLASAARNFGIAACILSSVLIAMDIASRVSANTWKPLLEILLDPELMVLGAELTVTLMTAAFLLGVGPPGWVLFVAIGAVLALRLLWEWLNNYWNEVDDAKKYMSQVADQIMPIFQLVKQFTSDDMKKASAVSERTHELASLLAEDADTTIKDDLVWASQYFAGLSEAQLDFSETIDPLKETADELLVSILHYDSPDGKRVRGHLEGVNCTNSQYLTPNAPKFFPFKACVYHESENTPGEFVYDKVTITYNEVDEAIEETYEEVDYSYISRSGWHIPGIWGWREGWAWETPIEKDSEGRTFAATYTTDKTHLPISQPTNYQFYFDSGCQNYDPDSEFRAGSKLIPDLPFFYHYKFFFDPGTTEEYWGLGRPAALNEWRTHVSDQLPNFETKVKSFETAQNALIGSITRKRGFVSVPTEKGLKWLRDAQLPDGSWRGSVGVTSLCALAFLNAGFDETDPDVNQAIQYILSNVRADGSIYSASGSREYETSMAVLALVATHNDAHRPKIENARNWLVNSQWDESSYWGSVNKDSWYYGGFGYGSGQRPDLSNTQFALLALDAAGLPKDDPTWVKAQVFLHRCQKVNFPITLNIEGTLYTVQPWNYAGTTGGYDGGFLYTPGSNPYVGGAPSMGSMTGAGIWGLLLSGVPKSDQRVTEAINWVANHYTWDTNPNCAEYRRYYYYLSMAKALTMYGEKFIGGHDWYQELYNKITSPTEMIAVDVDKVKWVPTTYEDYVPDLSTAYAILSLQTRAAAPPVQRLSYLTFILRSNCLLRILDSEGNLVGYNYMTGFGENNIPTAIYSGPFYEPQYIVIINPEPGTYRLELIGISEGPYELTIQGNYGEEITDSFEYEGEIKPAELHGSDLIVTAVVGPLDIYSNPPEFEEIIDNIPPATTLEIGEPKYVDPMDNIYVTSATSFTLTAEDNPGGMGVASTFYRIDNSTYDTGWLEYSAPFYLTELSDGEYSIDYYSTDNIGNTEPTNTATVIIDNTPPTTTLTIGEPKYISDATYVTPDTPFTLEATDTGSGIYCTAYRIYNDTYNSGWITYAGPFHLTSLTDGAYTIEYNSIDNVQNIEAARAINVTLFSWNYIFEDTYGRGTILKINIANKFFQFITPDKDYGIRKATYMRQCGRAIIIHHYDDELRLITTAVDTKLDFCVAIAWDQQTGKRYFLIDKVGNE